MPGPTNKYNNELIHESSPYLLQHAHNPVNWLAWNENSLQKAVDENKLILISIGYSSCHWCHVMEHESFEDTETAAIMNEHFICIKVDREERPDVDAVYMSAVQLISGRGGWPLNCITLPDQRPIYGGTYFPKQQWQQVLIQVAALFNNEPERCNQYASDLTAGVKGYELVQKSTIAFDKVSITADALLKRLESQFDTEQGGMNHAPKFPMPSNWELLLQISHHSKNKPSLQQLELTLKKMAYGGIYDQLAGGFARYSTDVLWKVPHFEKMLYDNAQLVSLYAHAFLVNKNKLYKETVDQTLDFIATEMTSPEGGFYSALDADSEGVEGKFYVWTKSLLSEILGDNAPVFFDYYNINELGYWEDDNYILVRDKDDEEIGARHNLTDKALQKIISDCKKILIEKRNHRIRPGLDDKQICSWNALMLKGYIDAYNAFNESSFLEAALKSANLILEKFTINHHLFRTYKNGNAKINGYLEDYAFVIDAFIALYQCTGETTWLNYAKQYAAVVKEEFFDEASGMLFFTSMHDEPLIARKMEIQDNVIPAAASAMAKNFFLLANYFSIPGYEEIAKQMVVNVADEIIKSTPWYSNWAQAALMMKNSFYEIVICGKNALALHKEFLLHYLPDALFAVATEETNLPLFEQRFVKNETLIYICRDKSCMAPVKTVGEALLIFEKHSTV